MHDQTNDGAASESLEDTEMSKEFSSEFVRNYMNVLPKHRILFEQKPDRCIDYTKAIVKVFDKNKDNDNMSVTLTLNLTTAEYEVIKAVNAKCLHKTRELKLEAANQKLLI